MARRFNRNRLLTAAIVALMTLAAAAAMPAAAAYDSAPIDDFIGTVSGAGGSIHSVAYNAALRLFWVLALVQFAWSGMQLGLRGEWTMNHVAALLVKEVLFIGLFYWLLTQADPSNSANIIVMISRGLRFLSGASGGNPSPPIKPSEFFVACVKALHDITNSAFLLGVYNAPWAVAPYALALVSLSFASAFAVAYLLEYFIVLPAGIILLGMGGNSASKPFATHYIKILIAVGLKLLCLQVLLSNAQGYVADAAEIFDSSHTSALASEGFFYHAFMFAGFSAVIFISIKTVPQLAANLVTGAYFGRVNWLEPASFPAAATAGAGAARAAAQPSGRGAAEVQSITGTVTVQNSGEFTGGGGPLSSSLSAGSAASAREQSSFGGAGFGNYAHDIVFGDDSPASSIPDARPTSRMPDASPTGGMSDARPTRRMPDASPTGGMSDARPTSRMPDASPTSGMSDARPTSRMPDASPTGGMSDARPTSRMPDASPTGGMSDARPTGGMPDASPTDGMPDARPTGGMPDASPTGGMPDARPTGGMPDARPTGGMPDARPTGGMPDARPTGGMPDARPTGGMPDARPTGGMPDARPTGGMPDARPAGGMPDARPAGGMPDARPAPTSADMRQAIKDSMQQ
jgi:type IV secretion system protein TrbL